MLIIREIKFMSNAMKLWDRVSECILKKETLVIDNQFGLCIFDHESSLVTTCDNLLWSV